LAGEDKILPVVVRAVLGLSRAQVAEGSSRGPTSTRRARSPFVLPVALRFRARATTTAELRQSTSAHSSASASLMRRPAVEAAWRIVEPVLGDATPLHTYEPGSWGPAEADRLIGDGRWQDPV
jgi:hypothetical protein